MNCGTILFDRSFQFSNTGKTSPKLSLVVFDAGDVHFVFVTTTKPKAKNSNAGCQIADILPNFYIPQNSTTWFTEPTWILLNELVDISKYLADAKITEKEMDVIPAPLPLSLLKDILNCALKSPDLDGFDKDFISRGLASLS